MRADEFYQFGQTLGGSVRSLLGLGETDEPVNQQQPQQPQQPSPPSGGPSMGMPQTTQGQRPPPKPGHYTGSMVPSSRPQQSLLGDFEYDTRITDSMVQQYLDAGFDPRFAIGMVANGVVESSLNTDAYNSAEDSYGMFQWRLDRLHGDSGLNSFADRLGKSANDLNTQVAFSIHEFGAHERVAFNRITGQDPQSAADYARLIDKHYERSSGHARDRRGAAASQLYLDYFGEGGRFADGNGALPAYGEDVVPTEQAQTRAQMLEEQMLLMQQGGDFHTAPGSNPADFTMAGSAVPAVGGGEDVAGSPTSPPTPTPTGQFSARSAGNATPPRGGQAPDGSYLPETGEQRDGLLGLRDVFMQREEEGGEEFRDRRRNMFLAAASGFDSLSTGRKADYNTPVQMRMQERQRRFDRQHNVSEAQRDQLNTDRTERRLTRAQDLAENRFSFDTHKYNMERSDTVQRREAIAQIADDAGLSVAADLARAGADSSAVELITKSVTPPPPGQQPFGLSDEATAAFNERMAGMGRADLGTAVADHAANPEAAELAYKEGIQLAMESGAVDQTAAVEQLKAMIPQGNISDSRVAELESAAEAAVDSGSDTVMAKFFDLVSDAQSSSSPASAFKSSVLEADQEEYQRTISASGGLMRAADNAAGIAINPDFDSGKLRSALLTPAARILRDIPGGEALAEAIGVDDIDIAGAALLDAFRNGQLGNLGQGVNGQLSNLEGDRLLSSLADGSLSRVEIMALSQAMRRGILQKQAAFRASTKYLEEAEHSWELEEYQDVKSEAAEGVRLFDRMSNDDRVARAAAVLEEAGVDDPRLLSNELAGTVVSVLNEDGGIEFVPLFAEMFGDEFQNYSAFSTGEE